MSYYLALKEENEFLKDMTREKDDMIAFLYKRNGDIIQFVDQMQEKMDKEKEKTIQYVFVDKKKETEKYIMNILTHIMMLEVGIIVGFAFVWFVMDV